MTQPEVRAAKPPSNTTLFILEIIVIPLSVEMQPTSIFHP
jgi:hypothetical protein